MHGHYGKLILIPNFLSDSNTAEFLPAAVRTATHHLKHFVVENEKAGRALIKKLAISTPQNELTIRLWNEHSEPKELGDLLQLFTNGMDVGLITDAGLPCVADPGGDVVAMAHHKNIQVVPLPGASSIFMALMASGMNGQGFTFHGYLPINRAERVKKIKELEGFVVSRRQSQIFMEAPYRNNHLLEDLLLQCRPETRLCIASNISAPAEFIKTLQVKDWKAQVPDLHKTPTIFILG